MDIGFDVFEVPILAGREHVEFDRWYEVIGVGDDFPQQALQGSLSDAKLYHRVSAGALHKEQALMRLAGALLALTLSVVLLSAAGIDALMSQQDECEACTRRVRLSCATGA